MCLPEGIYFLEHVHASSGWLIPWVINQSMEGDLPWRGAKVRINACRTRSFISPRCQGHELLNRTGWNMMELLVLLWKWHMNWTTIRGYPVILIGSKGHMRHMQHTPWISEGFFVFYLLEYLIKLRTQSCRGYYTGSPIFELPGIWMSWTSWTCHPKRAVSRVFIYVFICFRIVFAGLR